MKRIIDEAKRMITAKAIISAVSLGLFVPFAKLVYWLFDTAYLGGFGISPDVYSRPIFSSGFVSVWLVAQAMAPILTGWLCFAFALFIILFSINFGALDKPENIEVDFRIYKKDTWQVRFVKRFGYAIYKSYAWPFSILVCGLSLILFLLSVVVWASKEGDKLSETQVKAYASNGECKDKFNSSLYGCFTIEGIDGKGLFVIANPKTHLLFLSRSCLNGAAEVGGDCTGEYQTALHIHEKVPERQYSINREYKVAKASDEADKSKSN